MPHPSRPIHSSIYILCLRTLHPFHIPQKRQTSSSSSSSKTSSTSPRSHAKASRLKASSQLHIQSPPPNQIAATDTASSPSLPHRRLIVYFCLIFHCYFTAPPPLPPFPTRLLAHISFFDTSIYPLSSTLPISPEDVLSVFSAAPPSITQPRQHSPRIARNYT